MGYGLWVMGKSLLWKIPLGVVGASLGLVLLLLIAAGCVLYVKPLRQAVLAKVLPIVEEQTGLDINLSTAITASI